MIIANTEGLCDRKLPAPAYVGRTPIINASVVKPNEKPGLPGSVFDRLSQNSNHFYNWIMGNVEFKSDRVFFRNSDGN